MYGMGIPNTPEFDFDYKLTQIAKVIKVKRTD